MDFTSVVWAGGGKFRILTVIDSYNQEGLGIKVDLSLSSARVLRVLDQVIEWLGRPATIQRLWPRKLREELGNRAH